MPSGSSCADTLDRDEQDGDADEAGDEAADDEAARPLAGDDGVEEREPDRHRRDDDRGDPGRDEQLGEHDAAVAAEQQQRPDDRGRPPVRRARPLPGARRPRSRAWANSPPSMISPAVPNRTPAARSGGIVSIITAIAK